MKLFNVLYITLLLLPALSGTEADQTDLANRFLLRQYPGTHVEKKTWSMSQEQFRRIVRHIGEKELSRLHTFYLALTPSGEVKGYGIFDTHTVRTKKETLFLILNGDGTIASVVQIAFFEPDDYRAPERWLARFAGRDPSSPLATGQDIAAISGATLTTGAITRSVRKLLLLYRLHIRGESL